MAGGGTDEALRGRLAIEALAALRWASCVRDVGDCSDNICEITVYVICKGACLNAVVDTFAYLLSIIIT